MSGVARVRTSGSSFEEMVVIAKGEPENFLTDSEMRDKFDTLVGPYLDAGTLEALAGSLLQLDRESGVDALLDSTRSSRPASLKAV
jgi:hypothetical protein